MKTLKLFGTTYLACLTGLWGVVEGYTYFKGDELKIVLAQHWFYVLYGVPLIVASVVAFVQILRSHDNRAVELTQFYVDESLSCYRMFKYNSKRPLYPGKLKNAQRSTLTIPTGTIFAFGRWFESVEDVQVFQRELINKTNHYYFNWLSDYGYKPQEVPLAINKAEDESLSSKAQKWPILCLVLSSNSPSQVIINEVEFRVLAVVRVRSAGKTELLKPLNVYDLPIKSEVGVFNQALIPPIKIAANDSVNFSLRVVPHTKHEGPHGKVLIAQICVYTSIYADVKTPKFMMYFED